MDRRVRELDAERDPLSLPEEIVSEATKRGRPVGIPPTTDSAADNRNLAQLLDLSTEELVGIAES
ncbi:MAG: transcription termination factor Rho, partial [Planctomycetota bacterium]